MLSASGIPRKFACATCGRRFYYPARAPNCSHVASFFFKWKSFIPVPVPIETAPDKVQVSFLPKNYRFFSVFYDSFCEKICGFD